eukprot:3208111-Rhodomonas_salina.1
MGAPPIADALIKQTFHNASKHEHRELAVSIVGLRKTRQLRKEVWPAMRPFAFCDERDDLDSFLFDEVRFGQHAL